LTRIDDCVTGVSLLLPSSAAGGWRLLLRRGGRDLGLRRRSGGGFGGRRGFRGPALFGGALGLHFGGQLRVGRGRDALRFGSFHLGQQFRRHRSAKVVGRRRLRVSAAALGFTLGRHLGVELVLRSGLDALRLGGFHLGQQFRRHRGAEIVGRRTVVRRCRRRFRCGRRRGGCALALGHGIKLGNQRRILAFRLLAGFLQIAQQIANTVDALEDQRHRLRRHRQHAVAELAEHIFAGVGDRFQSRQAQEPAGALDGMDQTEDVAEDLRILRILLEFDEFAVDDFEALAGFRQEFTEQIVHATFSWVDGAGMCANLPLFTAFSRPQRDWRPRAPLHTIAGGLYLRP